MLEVETAVDWLQPPRPKVALEPEDDLDSVDWDSIVTEDDTPVDGLFAERQHRLLIDTLYASWQPGRVFYAATNVGVFRNVKVPPIVPDAFISFDVLPPKQAKEKRQRSYFVQVIGKAPEVVVEVVSNREGEELGRKLEECRLMGVWYYVVYDPEKFLSKNEPLRIYEWREGLYIAHPGHFLERMGLGLQQWRGDYEDYTDATWLRWCDAGGQILWSGKEQMRLKDREIEQERQLTALANQRAIKLAAQLRALGIEPEA